MLDRRTVLCSSIAAAALAGTGFGRQALAYGSGGFTFIASAVTPTSPDPTVAAMLSAFGSGQIDRYTHYHGMYNSVAGRIHVEMSGRSRLIQPYPGRWEAQFHVWGCSSGIEGVRIVDANGNRQGVSRPPPYVVSIPEFGPPDYIFDLVGGAAEVEIIFPPGFLTPQSKAQWCAPTLASIRPRPGEGIPYTAREIAWHMDRSPFTTTFFLTQG